MSITKELWNDIKTPKGGFVLDLMLLIALILASGTLGIFGLVAAVGYAAFTYGSYKKFKQYRTRHPLTY